MTRTIELPQQSRQVNQLRHSEHVNTLNELHNELHEELAELNHHHALSPETEKREATAHAASTPTDAQRLNEHTVNKHAVSQVELERQAYRRKQRNKSIATSLISTVILVAVVVVALHNSPGWPRVKENFLLP